MSTTIVSIVGTRNILFNKQVRSDYEDIVSEKKDFRVFTKKVLNNWATYSKGLEINILKPILKKYENTELVQEVISKHAYVLTVMGSLIAAARNDGVVPSSEFLWLKPVDRRLWYMLNCIGRQTPYAEVGGPFAHWRAEKVMGRRCLVPMIDEAIRALEVAIKEIKLTPRQMEELEP